VNWYTDHNKAQKALEVLLRSPRKEDLLQLSPEILEKLKQSGEIENTKLRTKIDKLSKVVDEIDIILSEKLDVECEICERTDYSYELSLPHEWGWVDAGFKHYLICDQCITRWAIKYNELPEVVKEI